jgi:hypothetical protein
MRRNAIEQRKLSREEQMQMLDEMMKGQQFKAGEQQIAANERKAAADTEAADTRSTAMGKLGALSSGLGAVRRYEQGDFPTPYKPSAIERMQKLGERGLADEYGVTDPRYNQVPEVEGLTNRWSAQDKAKSEKEKYDSEQAFEREKFDETKRKNRAEETQKAKEASSKTENGGSFKQNQYTAAGFAKRMELAESDLAALESKGFNPASNMNSFQTGKIGLGPLKVGIPEVTKSENVKSYEQAKRNFINATLRRESGAAISPSEFDSANAQYFPQVGDSPKIQEQKRRNREIAYAMMKSEAGGAFDEVGGNIAKPKDSSANKFNSLEEAEAANLPAGTVVYIDGRKAVVE